MEYAINRNLYEYCSISIIHIFSDIMTSKQDDTLTAVVIADSYTNNFHPLTLNTPHCLQNVAGRPLLDYTLSWLHFNSVTEVQC